MDKISSTAHTPRPPVPIPVPVPGPLPDGPPGDPTRAGGDVALLVDWENLKWSLQNCYRATPNISALVEASREYGRLVVARAYADWTLPRLSPDAPNLYRAGIEPVYVPSRHPLTPGGLPLKNSADVRLAVDAVDLCGRLPHVGAYLLVTGDGDLIHALNFLRLNGRRGIVIGVGDTMNALLSAAADTVLLYERDIEPPDGLEADLDRPIRAHAGAPAVEQVFAWVADWLRERGATGPHPLEEAQRHLGRRHGLDARRWYGLRLKDLLLRAQAAGLVHLSVIGNVDHVSLPTLPVPAPEAAPQPGDEARAVAPDQPWGSRAEVTLDALSGEEQRALLQFLRALDHNSPFMTFKYLVDNVMYHTVLPQLAREQVRSLVDDLDRQGILARSTASGIDRDTGDPFTYAHLTLNGRHQLVRSLLGLPALDDGVLEPACAEALAVVEELGGVSGLGVRFGRFEEAHAALERRLDRGDHGRVEAAVALRTAEQHGLVQRRRLDDGSDVVLAAGPHAPLPPLHDTLHHRAVWYALGHEGLQQILRTLVTAEDRVGGLAPLVSLVAQVEGLVDAAVRPNPRGQDRGRAGAPAAMARTGAATRLITRDLVDAGAVAPLVTRELDDSGGMRRTEVYQLARDHPLVRRAIDAGPVALPAAAALRRLAVDGDKRSS